MYIGEQLNIQITGDRSYNLDQIDFCVYIYPDGCVCGDICMKKEDCFRLEDGSYLCMVSPAVTSKMHPSSYTVEYRDKTGSMTYVHKHAFRMELCASATDIN